MKLIIEVELRKEVKLDVVERVQLQCLLDSFEEKLRKHMLIGKDARLTVSPSLMEFIQLQVNGGTHD